MSDQSTDNNNQETTNQEQQTNQDNQQTQRLGDINQREHIKKLEEENRELKKQQKERETNFQYGDDFRKEVEKAAAAAFEKQLSNLAPDLKQFQLEREAKAAEDALVTLEKQGASKEVLDKMVKENPHILKDVKDIYTTYMTQYAATAKELEKASGKEIPSTASKLGTNDQEVQVTSQEEQKRAEENKKITEAEVNMYKNTM